VFSADQADTILAEVDTFLFPYWWHAAHEGSTHGATCLTGGLFGPIPGGHNNVADKGSATQRAWSLTRYLCGAKHPANHSTDLALSTAATLITPTRYYRQWCVQDEIHDHKVAYMTSAVAEDFSGALNRYRDLNIATVEDLVEAFEVDHRLRQFINGQLLSGSSRLPLRNPFTNPDLLSLATSLPLPVRIHNKLHQAWIRRLAPQLLKYPMAATLTPAYAPIAIQEFSRVCRIAWKAAGDQLERSSRGRIKSPRLGWPAFSFLREYQPFHDLVDDLKLDIWDRVRMHHVTRASKGNLHSLLDMVAKCKTTDYRLSARFPGAPNSRSRQVSL